MSSRHLGADEGAPITVRAADLADAEFIAHANAAMALETEDKRLDPAVLGAGVRAALQDPAKGRYLVAELDSSAIGCLLLTLEWSDWRNRWIWWIQSVYVMPAARGKGAFHWLFRRVVDEAREEGSVWGIRLYVERDNERAMATYRRQGMVETAYRLFELPL